MSDLMISDLYLVERSKPRYDYGLEAEMCVWFAEH